LSRLTTRELAVAALFTALLAVSAFISIPIGSVPFTLQVFVVLLAGMVLGPRLGVLAVLAYLVLGLVAPVYSGGSSGLGVLFGPTGGYLVGFIPAVVVAGVVAGKHCAGVTRLTLAGLAGIVPIYLLGATWLAVQLDLTPGAAIAAGVAPFLWVDVLKALAAALTARALVSLPLGLPAETPRGR
jgi:biotin transport system substrate-specific component